MANLGQALVLADSGPLAALFNTRDHHHAKALDFFFRTHEPRLKFLTTWEVVSEVVYFLDLSAHAQADFLLRLHTCHAQGSIDIAALAMADLPGLSAMMRRYADRPMDLADASLV